jgi:hypothetical protein
MYGIPSAGAVGSALSTGRALAFPAVSPSQNFAIGVAADTGELLILIPSADGSAATVSSLTGVAAGANRIVLSPDGSAAAAWFSSTGHLQVISGLPASPSVVDIDASFLGADPAALSVSDDGQWVVGVWAQGVYAFGGAGQVITLPVDTPVALSFFHRRADLALATATQMIMISDIGGAAVPAVLWSAPVDPAQPAPAGSMLGAGVSFDNNSVVTVWDSGALVTSNLVTGASTSADCGCAPTGIFGLGGSAFRLTGLSSGALKVFNSATGEVSYVPLAASSAAGGQQ